MSTSPQSSTGEGSTSVKLQPELLSLHLDYGSNGHLFKLCTLEVPSSNPELDYTWILAPMGTPSSYAHLKFQAPISSLITLGFWLQWAPSNFFKLYTLEAFSLWYNETLSSFQDLSNTNQALMNTKVHSKICKCNECTHKLSLRTNTQEKRWLRASLLFFK